MNEEEREKVLKDKYMWNTDEHHHTELALVPGVRNSIKRERNDPKIKDKFVSLTWGGVGNI